MARQHFKDTLGLSPTTAMPPRPGSPFPAEPVFITKVLPLCPAAPKTQTEVATEVRGKFGGAGREGGGRGGEGALCWVALGWERRAPSTVHPNAGQGKVSAHGCGHQILVSGHVGAAVRGWNSALCRCTGAKSHPAGADGQAGAAEPAVQDASCPRGAAGITLVVGVGTPATSAPALWSFWPGGLH